MQTSSAAAEANQISKDACTSPCPTLRSRCDSAGCDFWVVFTRGPDHAGGAGRTFLVSNHRAEPTRAGEGRTCTPGDGLRTVRRTWACGTMAEGKRRAGNGLKRHTIAKIQVFVIVKSQR